MFKREISSLFFNVSPIGIGRDASVFQ